MSDTYFVLGLIVVIGILFASNRVRLDVIALLAVLALMLSGILTVPEALAGFGDSVVILVAGLLIVGEMLERTGVAQIIGDWILRIGGKSETRMMVLIMVAAALLGSIMSSTAIVAIFIPIILKVSTTAKLNASRLLMPMSYAALISGMLTLIATPPNLVISGSLADAGYTPLTFFGFAPIGLAVLAIAIVYMQFFGKRLLGPKTGSTGDSRRPTLEEMRQELGVAGIGRQLKVLPSSPLAGQSLGQAQLRTRYNVNVIGILKTNPDGGKQAVVAGDPDSVIMQGDRLVVFGLDDDITALRDENDLEPILYSSSTRQEFLKTIGGAAVLIHPQCRHIGESVQEAKFRTRYGVDVLSIRRSHKNIEDYTVAHLHSADILVVAGAWDRVVAMSDYNHDFVMLQLPEEASAYVPGHRRAPLAVAILIAMVVLSVFNVVPIVAAVLMAGLAAVVTRCITMEEAYRSIHWTSIVLLAGLLPVAYAFEVTGGIDLVVNAMVNNLGEAGPYAIMAALFGLTAGLGLFLSNTACAVLMAPVAIASAEALGASPYPFAITVLIAASAAFVTPVSTPVVTLVVEPGDYRFMDFVKVGVPLLLMTFFATLFLTPLIFPM